MDSNASDELHLYTHDITSLYTKEELIVKYDYLDMIYYDRTKSTHGDDAQQHEQITRIG